MSSVEFKYFVYDDTFDFESNKDQDIHTALPKNSAIVRVAVTILITAYAITKISSPLWCWPVAIVGVGFAGWTIYSSFIRRDPLTQAFHDMVAVKKKFETLDLYGIPANESVIDYVKMMNWEKSDPITHGIHDGRHVVIIKAMKEYLDSKKIKCEERIFCAFVEKIEINDSGKTPKVVKLFFDFLSAFYYSDLSRFQSIGFLGITNIKAVTGSVSSAMLKNFTEQYKNSR